MYERDVGLQICAEQQVGKPHALMLTKRQTLSQKRPVVGARPSGVYEPTAEKNCNSSGGLSRSSGSMTFFHEKLRLLVFARGPGPWSLAKPFI